MSKEFKSNTSVVRDILKESRATATAEIPMDNPEAQQDETPADRVLRRYVTHGAKLAQIKHKVIDNA